jgi:hypothetical protein
MIHFRIHALAPVCLIGASALLGCRASDSQPVMDERVDNAMLQHVALDERGDVTDARHAADVARDAHAAAKADTQSAIGRRKLASRDLDIAQAELKRAEEAFELAEHGTQEELATAKSNLDGAKSVVTSVRSRIILRDRQVDHAKAVETLKLDNNELAQAKVESTKAHAVKELDRPESKSLDLNAFEHQVRKFQEKVQLDNVRVEAARKEVVAARTSYDVTVKAVPAALSKDWPSEPGEPSVTKE